MRLTGAEADDQHRQRHQEAAEAVRPEQAEREFLIGGIGAQGLVRQVKRGGKQRKKREPV